jgi:hypothetical protein
MNTRKSCREIKRRGLMIMLAILLALMTTMPGLAQTGPNTMNFQGRLLDSGGEPRGGETHCMCFRMCKEPTCMLFGSVVWPSKLGYEYHVVTTESGPYKAGLFTVTLGDSVPITPDLLYNYDTLYLEINVSDSSDKCTEASYTTLTPRSKIQTSAYAQRSRRVRTAEGDDDYLVNVENTGAGGGVYGEADSVNGVGVYGIAPLTGTVGIASATSGKTYGVYGETNSTSDDAAAGAFHAAGDSGQTYGVYVENNSTDNYAAAGYFHADGDAGRNYGVYAKNDSTGDYASAGFFVADGNSGRTTAVYAQNDSTSDNAKAGDFWANGNSGVTYGVYATNDSASGIGVYGIAPLTGTVGIASATSGKTYGVYGKTHSTSDDASAGYFHADGDSGETYGVFVRNESTGDISGLDHPAAGYFWADGDSGVTYGVFARNDSTTDDASAGAFHADGDSGKTYGVYATNDSTSDNAKAGYFHADGDSGKTYGVYARNDSTTDDARAGYFWANGNSGDTYGVYATNDSTDGVGVYGTAPLSGVVGIASATSDQTYGVYGGTNSTTGAGVYARGMDSGADLILGGNASTSVGDDGRILSDPAYVSSDIYLVSNDTIRIDLDNNGDGEDADFEVYDKDDILLFNVDDSGRTSVRGNLVIRSSSTGDTIIELGEGLDYAEGFDVSDENGIAPGAVLVIDPDHPGQLMISRIPYDNRVAGIVAGAKGLGSAMRVGAGQFDYDVALAGRVYCNVDATEMGVEAGDLLTTSTLPGYAMKVTDNVRAQGAILGKAMERLEKGERGQILVLVTLQ